MKLTTGIDLVEIPRIAKSLTNARFIDRVFGREEQAQYQERGSSVSFLAANFAAKEAFSKALGTGFHGFSLTQVQVLRDALGAPYFSLSGQAAALVAQKNLQLSLSLTHTGSMAAAFVVAYCPPL